MTLADIKDNKKYIIKEINCNDKVKKRLLDIGLTKGIEINIKGKAPLGDPLLINLRGFNLALRKQDAKDIIVK